MLAFFKKLWYNTQKKVKRTEKRAQIVEILKEMRFTRFTLPYKGEYSKVEI